MKTVGTIYAVLKERELQLAGSAASAEQLAVLDDVVRHAARDELLDIYRQLSVCGMSVAYSLDECRVPGPPAFAPYVDDPRPFEFERDHEFYWMPPEAIRVALRDSSAAPLICAGGFVPIGVRTFGGDDYYLGPAETMDAPIPLVRLYRDWLNPDAHNTPPPEAIEVVASSFADVLRVAVFAKGL